MNKLSYASRFSFMDLIQDVNSEEIILTDLQKKPLVRIHINPSEKARHLKYNTCEWLLLFMESVYKDKNYVRKDGAISLIYRYLINGNKEAYYNIAEPYDDKQTDLRKWKLELQKIACYFPVRRVENQCTTGGTDKYTVEIKLPDFDPCCQDTKCEDPCKSGFKEPDCTSSCHASWISDCCFETCCEALEYYISSLKLLRGIDNYKPVFDCDCGSYGIELHAQLTLKEREDYFKKTSESLKDKIICSLSGDYKISSNQKRLQNENLCLSEIIAINPQFYTNPEMACDAVNRSRKLINSEGLHLVEHILLRPRCKDDNGNYIECGCKGLPRPCIDKKNLCHFQWKPGGDPDPCTSRKTVCLTPGCDPYSFVATVILPAWPERFRSESGRKIMEKMLQREAPAHILLRIMWLRPLDFCCLELYYKLWLEWLAQKYPHPPDTNCAFLTLLFEKEYIGLSPCRDCIPCGCGEEQVSTCTPEVRYPCDKYSVLSRINELFCWSHNQKLKSIDCETILETGYLVKKSEKKSSSESINVADVNSSPSVRLKDEFRLGQMRAHRYEVQINQIKDVNPDNEIVSRAIVFLKNRNPNTEEYTRLAEAIIHDKSNAAKGIKGLNKSQKQAVIENITWKYLDYVCIIGKDTEMIRMLQEKFSMLSEKGIDMNTLYQGWEGGKLSEFEPDIDYKKIKKWLLGR